METNPLENPAEYHKTVTNKTSRWVDWTTPGLEIVRLRLLSDPGFPVWDVSYCHGRIGDEYVRVSLPFFQLSKSKSISSQIVKYAIADGVHAKKMGLLAAISTFN